MWVRRAAEADALADEVNDTVVVGYERTIEQDAAFGFRQLEDICEPRATAAHAAASPP
jgi:uncharacterized membrane protein